VRRLYRKGGELGMEEENVLRFQSSELSVAWLVHQLLLPIRSEAAYHQLEYSEAGKESNGCDQRRLH
jgi:hypothetical protein